MQLSHTWQMCATRSRLSSAGGSCGRQTAGHSSCRAQGPRSVGGTLPWLARPLGTASPSTCGLHRCLEIHSRKNLKLIYLAASALEVFCNWALYKLTYSFIIHSFIGSHRQRRTLGQKHNYHDYAFWSPIATIAISACRPIKKFTTTVKQKIKRKRISITIENEQ